MGVKIFLARSCRETVSVIKKGVQSVEGFIKVQERRLVFDTQAPHGWGVRFEVGVEVGISGFRREKIFFTAE